MPRPKQVSDEQITSAARKVFLQVGVNAPVALVAKALGVTPAALFHRTGSKEQLFVMAMKPTDPRQFKLLKHMEDGPAAGTPVRAQLVEILTRLSSHLAVTSPNLFLLFAAGMLKPHQRNPDLPGQTRKHLVAWLRRARRFGDLHCRSTAVMAEALVGSLEARHLYGYLHGRETSVAQERRFVRALVNGLFGTAPAAPAAAAARGSAAETSQPLAAPRHDAIDADDN
ncbi:MAG TPA: TetR/AcrR family transcriptional regulator [Steroidobacteraceae bacterium]|jgi:AcrR family transcriptional regulator|nr:TetR/AcrR family transcriptional regulator [Steroidobacteraceae bacterium]